MDQLPPAVPTLNTGLVILPILICFVVVTFAIIRRRSELTLFVMPPFQKQITLKVPFSDAGARTLTLLNHVGVIGEAVRRPSRELLTGPKKKGVL